MRVDGLIILDTNGKPLITSHFPSHPPSYPSVCIDAFNHASNSHFSGASSSSSKQVDLEPVVWVNTLNRTTAGGVGMGMGGAGICHIQREGLRFLVPVGQEVNPLFAFSFLESFLETLQDYLGDVTETALKDNFDIVYMLVEEMLDEGHPTTMESAMLKEIVLPPTLMRKLLNVAGVSGIQAPTTAPLAAPIPWRKQGVRHSNNEIYFDISESLDAIVDKKGNVLSTEVWGLVNCNSRLSGNPDLILTFHNPKVMSDCSFHPCIRYNKWIRDGILSFVPPDGKFKLFEFQGSQQSPSAGRVLPLALKTGLVVEENGGRFSLTLSSKINRVVEDIVVSIYLGSGTTNVSATATGDRPVNMGMGMGQPLGAGAGKRQDVQAEGFAGGGTWEFDPNSQMLRWKISSLAPNERAPTLTGSFTSSEPHPTPSPSFQVTFQIPNHTFTGLKVNQLKVVGDVMYKPFKGVRQVAKAGKIDFRW